MGFRFRRSFRVMPGWRVNLSKSGASSSFGTRGARFTVGPRGTRETIGIPGTGLSYTEQQSAKSSPSRASSIIGGIITLLFIFALGWIIGTFIA